MRRVNPLTRIWLVCADDLPLSDDTVELVARIGARAWLRGPELAPDRVSATAARLNQPIEECLDVGLGDASLRTLADRHPAESVVILTSRAAVVALLHAALGLAESTALGALHFQVCALDWPCSADPEGRPALIGVDLDWLPPPPPSRRAKFPGGPGSAAANR